MLWRFLNHWWNLPYLVMLGLVAVFFVLQTLGLVTDHGDADADGDVHPDVDAEADADADLDHDADLSDTFLAFLGVGRVPFMVIWLTFFIFTGFAGVALNRWVFESFEGGYPGWAFPATFAGSTLVGLFAVRTFSRLAARVVDLGGRGATSKHQLIGHPGVIASARLDQRFGEIRVRDARGDELIVHGQLEPGAPALERGQQVVLLDYDDQAGLFRVSAMSGVDAPAAERMSVKVSNRE